MEIEMATDSDLIGKRIIINGTVRHVSHANLWRRGVIIDGPKMRFGRKHVQVRLERRGKEVECTTVWQALAWCLLRSKTIEDKLTAQGLLHGHDDVCSPNAEVSRAHD